MSLTFDNGRTIVEHRRPRGAPALPALDLTLQLRCLDAVMRACREVADDAGQRTRFLRPTSTEAIDSAAAVLATDGDVDVAITRHLARCADAVGAASEGFLAIGPTTRRLLVVTNRSLHRDPTLSGQRSVLAAIVAKQTWQMHPVDRPDAERLEAGLVLARAVVGAAWADCRDDVMTFRRVVSGARGAAGPDPYLHVVAATVAGSLSGALSCPPGTDPREAGLALGLAGAVRQVVCAAMSVGRPGPPR